MPWSRTCTVAHALCLWLLCYLLQAFQRLSQLEGIIPALETSHALAYLEKLCPTLKVRMGRCGGAVEGNPRAYLYAQHNTPAHNCPEGFTHTMQQKIGFCDVLPLNCRAASALF